MNEHEKLYLKIKKYLLSIINENMGTRDFKLPSENQLAMKFKASRVTVKKAVNELADEGYIICFQGKGSFINPDYKKLKTDSGFFVCFVLPDFSSPFFSRIAYGAFEYFMKNDVIMTIFHSDNNLDNEYKFLNNLNFSDYKGILIIPVRSDIYNKGLISLSLKNYPIVSIDRDMYSIDVSSVKSNHYQMAYDATSYLIKNGHKDILFIHSDEQVSSIKDRIIGYKDALADNNIIPDKKLIKTFPFNVFKNANNNALSKTEEELEAILLAMQNVSAIIILNSVLARNLSSKITNAQRKIQMVLFDDNFPEHNHSFPPNTIIIEQNAKSIGEKAAHMLMQKIRKNDNKTKVVNIKYVAKTVRGEIIDLL